MNIGPKPGMTRRPLEYALWLIMAALTIALLWAVSSLNKESQTVDLSPQASESQRPEPGTREDIGWLTQRDIDAEESIDKKYDEQQKEAASADSAADNIGGVYDETEY